MEGHWLHEYMDETSQFDPEGVWTYGLECYMTTHRLWVPDSIDPDDDEALNAYIDDSLGVEDGRWA